MSEVHIAININNEVYDHMTTGDICIVCDTAWSVSVVVLSLFSVWWQWSFLETNSRIRREIKKSANEFKMAEH